ncbi:MAG: asparaginase [Planctomycetota bacterium]|jgi:L-asparaginase II
MENPVLLDVHRGPLVESHHRGAFAVWRGDSVVRSAGDIDSPIFLRSAAKPFQALEFVASGAAEAFGVPDEELAVACASHGAEDLHVDAVVSMLGRAKLDPSVLRCGPHPPACTRANVALARSGGKPESLHNNCSGKHAAMVMTAHHRGLPLETYLDPAHPLQASIRENVARFAGMDSGDIVLGTDGCSAPNFALPVRNTACAFATLAAPGDDLPPALAAAARRIAAAMAAHPRRVAWEDRGDSALMGCAPGRLATKLGAEGVQGVAVLDAGVGIALKFQDGAGRPRVPVTVALLRALGLLSEEEAAAVGRDGDLTLRNHAGLEVGRLEVILPEIKPLDS